MKKIIKSMLTLLLISILLISITNIAFAVDEGEPIHLKNITAPYVSTVQK